MPNERISRLDGINMSVCGDFFDMRVLAFILILDYSYDGDERIELFERLAGVNASILEEEVVITVTIDAYKMDCIVPSPVPSPPSLISLTLILHVDPRLWSRNWNEVVLEEWSALD